MHVSIQRLIRELDKEYPGNWEYYGDLASPPDDNMGFRIFGSKALFSVSTIGGTLPENQLDIQIEHPQGATYIYTDELPLDRFMGIVVKFLLPESDWPNWDG